MTEVSLADDVVPIAPTDLGLADVTLALEVPHDLLHRPLGDPDRLRHVSHAGIRVSGQGDQHVCVIGEERPLA